MRITGDLQLSFVALLIFCVMVGLSLGYSREAALLPLVIGIPGALLSLTQLIVELRSAVREPRTVEVGEVPYRRILGMFGWFASFTAAVVIGGYLVGGPLLLFAFLFFGRRESLALSLAMAGSGFLVLLLGFERLLEIPLFRGLLVERWIP